MKCPRCGHEEVSTRECSRCGVTFLRPEPSAQPPPRQTVPAWAIVVVLGLAALGGAAWWVHRPMEAPSALQPAVDGGPTGELPRLEQAAQVGCPRRIRPSESIKEQATEDPVPPGWLADKAGYARALSPERAGSSALVLFTVPWCRIGQRVDEQLFGDAAVRKRLRHTVLVRVNPEAGAEEDALANEYGVAAYPSLYVLRDGTPSQRVNLLSEIGGNTVMLRIPDFFTAIESAGWTE